MEIVKKNDAAYSDMASKKFAQYANDASGFLKIYKSIAAKNYNNPDELVQSLQALLTHKFFKKVNKEAGFSSAKNKLINQGVVTKRLRDVKSSSPGDYFNYLALEHCCATIISHICDNFQFDELVVKADEKKSMRKQPKIRKLIRLARNFELDAEEQLFNLLVRKLEKSMGSQTNLNKRHDNEVREYMTKRLFKVISMYFSHELLSMNLVVDVVLDITTIFFDKIMNKYDAEALFDGLRKSAEKEQVFLKKTVEELILESVII